MPLLRAGICCCLLILEVGEALGEVVLGMPRLGVLFALGLRGGADESLHANLALHGRIFGGGQITEEYQKTLFNGKGIFHKQCRVHQKHGSLLNYTAQHGSLLNYTAERGSLLNSTASRHLSIKTRTYL